MPKVIITVITDLFRVIAAEKRQGGEGLKFLHSSSSHVTKNKIISAVPILIE